MRFRRIKGQPDKLLDTQTGRILMGVHSPIEERVRKARWMCGCDRCRVANIASASGSDASYDTCNMAAAIFAQLPDLIPPPRSEDERQERIPGS